MRLIDDILEIAKNEKAAPVNEFVFAAFKAILGPLMDELTEIEIKVLLLLGGATVDSDYFLPVLKATAVGLVVGRRLALKA